MESIFLFVAFVVGFFALIQGFLYFSHDLREETRETWSQIRRPSLADGVSPWLRDILLTAPIRQFDNLVQTCGIRARTESILLVMMIVFVVALALCNFYTSLSPQISLFVAFAAGLFPMIILSWVRGRRMAKLTEQIPETLDMMVRSLRAGHPIPVSITMVSREMPEPIGGEFRRVSETMIYGLDLRSALSYMADRLHTVSELKYVVSAIRIQSASGGNLAEVLGSLSKLMRNQQKLKMKVKALSAEGRLSGNILAGLPVGVFVLLTIISPAYYQGISENQILLSLMGIAGFLLAAGYIIMCRLVKIRV